MNTSILLIKSDGSLVETEDSLYKPIQDDVDIYYHELSLQPYLKFVSPSGKNILYMELLQAKR